MVKNIILDVGKVLVAWEPEDAMKKLGFDDKTVKVVADATVNTPVWLETDRGVWSDEQILQAFYEKAPEYKKEIKEKIENQQMYQNLLNALVDQIEVKKDLPKDKVKEQKEAIINQYESTAEYYQMELGDYLTQYMGMTEDQFKEKAQTVAENTVRNQMAVELLCEKKNLEPTDKEYEIGLKQYAALAGYRTDQIAEYEEKNGKENIEQSIMQEKSCQVSAEELCSGRAGRRNDE